MDFLSDKLKDTIDLNNQNNKFKQLIKTSSKINGFIKTQPFNNNNKITKRNTTIPIYQDLIASHKQLVLDRIQLHVQTKPQSLKMRSISQKHLTFKIQNKIKRSNSNIRISSRKSERTMSISKKQQRQQIQSIVRQTSFTTPFNQTIGSSLKAFKINDKIASVRKISDLIEGINSQLILVVKQFQIRQTADFRKLQEIMKETRKSNQMHAQILQMRINYLKQFIKKYKIKNSTIKVSDLIRISRRKIASNFQILTLFNNWKQILQKNKNIPGIIYYYPNIVTGKILAANKIISVFKMLSSKKYANNLASLMKKVKLIQKYWKKCLIIKRHRQRFMNRMNQKLQISGQLQQKLQKSWQIIKSSKKVQVHICSLSLQSFKRLTLQNKQQFQNSQINRIFKAFQIDTSVIYVSPIQISSDLIKYYQRLFKISSKQFDNRVSFVIPQNIKLLSSFCQLTTTNYLLYSPVALKKIKKQLKYYETAYIVPSYPSVQYINLSIQLNIPVMSSSMSQSKLLSTKIGCHQIFQSVCKDSNHMLKMLKSVDSIYTEKQLLNCLAVLIFKNQNVKRWYFKIDDEISGRGLAYFNVNSIAFLKNIQGSKNQQTLQLIDDKDLVKLIRKQIQSKIKSKLKILRKDVYPTYSQYITHFLTRGGVIQASPQNQVEQVSISFYIQPNGDFQILGTYQKVQINSRNICQAIKSPTGVQIDYEIIIRNFYRKLYQKRKMYGYFSVDLLYEKSSKTVYPIGLDCFLNCQSSSLIFTKYITDSIYKKDTNKYIVQQKQFVYPVQNLQLSLKSIVSEKNQKSESIIFYYCPKIQLLHLQNLNVFFKKCKFQNISFDIKTKTGTLFLLLDDLQSESIGFLCCQTSIQKLNQQANHSVQFLSKNYRIQKGKNKKQFDQIGFLRGAIGLQLNQQNKKKEKAPQITLSDFF